MLTLADLEGELLAISSVLVVDIVDAGTHLEEAEFIWCLMRADDDCLHIADVDIATGDGQSWKTISEERPRVESAGWRIQRSEFFWMSLNS